MIKLINKILQKFGVQIKRSASLMVMQNYQTGIIEGAKELYRIRSTSFTCNDKLAALAFSKDRPLQLHALLSSYFKLVRNAAPVHIIYKASTAEIEKFYDELKREFSDRSVYFIQENNFYLQVKDWLDCQAADRIFFLTDDAIFLEEVDLFDSFNFDPLNEIFTLRYGKDLDFSFAYNRRQQLPPLDQLPGPQEKIFFQWRWDAMPDSPDWNYPLSVDGNIYLRKEMAAICKHIKFRSPNSLESNIQVFADFFLHRKGVCYSKVKMVNVPCNMVQAEVSNRATGLYTVEELLTAWKEKKHIVTEDFYKLNAIEAMNMKYRII